MSCQICVEVCPFEAIKMDTEYELATDDRFGGLLLDRNQLAKSNEYYHKIHPTEAAEVDARLAEEKAKAEAKAKACCGSPKSRAAAAKARRSLRLRLLRLRREAPARRKPSPSMRQREARDAESSKLRRRKPETKKERQLGMADARSDLCSSQALGRGLVAGRVAAVRGCVAERGGDHRDVSGVVRVDDGAGAQRARPNSESNRPKPHRAIRNSAAGRRRHQVADQGRYCSAERGCGGAFPGAVGAGGGRCSWDLRCCPWAATWQLVDMDAGLLFFFAIGASTELSIFMAGWSSRNKYSLLGAMRAVAQMISYEVPLLMSSVAVVMITGSLSLVKIVEAQNQYTWGLPHWYIFTPWGFAGFLMYAVAATAETNRSPFDLPEGESELVAGYFTEYSGFKFALFFLGEYLGMFSMSGLGATLYLGGWSAPLAALQFCALVDLVLLQGDAFDLRIDLAARNAAALAAGPVDEFCVEVCAADDAAQSVCCRAVAIHGRGLDAMGGVLGDPDCWRT